MSSGRRNYSNLVVQGFILKMGKLRPRKGKPEVTLWVGAKIRLEPGHLTPSSRTFLPRHKAASFESHLYWIKTKDIQISHACAQGERYKDVCCCIICHQRGKKKSTNNLNIPHQRNTEANCDGFIGWNTIQQLKWMHLINIVNTDKFLKHPVWILKSNLQNTYSIISFILMF